MSDSRLTRKERKNKSRSVRRKVMLKNQGFQPVIKAIDIQKVKQEFKEKAAAKQEKTLTKPDQ